MSYANAGYSKTLNQEQKTFIPDEIFDFHVHVYRKADLDVKPGEFLPDSDVSIELWRQEMLKQFPAVRLTGGLFFGYPLVKDINVVNDWLLKQLISDKDSRGLILVSPDSKPKMISRYFEDPKIIGFKPYFTFSQCQPADEADVSDFLPQWVWEMAEQKTAIIMLHLPKDCALSDPANISEICDKCVKYPRAKLVLAHAGRGFHYQNTVKGIAALKDLQNVWFDSSAICEPAALYAVLQAFGPRKLLWGSDFPLSTGKGKCISVGDTYVWLTCENMPAGSKVISRLASVGAESLGALREASDYFGLNEDDVRDIFSRNALRLLGILKESPHVQELYKYAKTRIPAGTQLLSKRPEIYAPNQWPPYFREARGCETWDIDGKHYYDMATNGIGACLLGFRDPDVTRAVHRRVNLGSMATLNPPEEVELADLLCEIHPWAQQVRFTRTGGEAAMVAVRIARATTKRSLVAVCGYHGWHDWYLAANLGETDALDGHLLPGLNPLGVPKELRGTTLTFRYNNRQQFQDILNKFGDRLAAVVMEPARHHDPEPGFLEFVHDGAHKHGALLIFDEITIGWRCCLGGIHLKFGVNPDIAMFAKTLGNGHPIGAVLGTRDAMEGAHTSFISSTIGLRVSDLRRQWQQ